MTLLLPAAASRCPAVPRPVLPRPVISMEHFLGENKSTRGQGEKHIHTTERVREQWKV